MVVVVKTRREANGDDREQLEGIGGSTRPRSVERPKGGKEGKENRSPGRNLGMGRVRLGFAAATPPTHAKPCPEKRVEGWPFGCSAHVLQHEGGQVAPGSRQVPGTSMPKLCCGSLYPPLKNFGAASLNRPRTTPKQASLVISPVPVWIFQFCSDSIPSLFLVIEALGRGPNDEPRKVQLRDIGK